MKYISLAASALLLFSCHLSRTKQDERVEYWFRDSSNLSSETYIESAESTPAKDVETPYQDYKASHEKSWLLKHTDLKVEFMFSNRSMVGTARITLAPFAQPADSLILDAKNMLINRVSIAKPETGVDAALAYTYHDSAHLGILFPEPVPADKEITIQIEYVAFPYESNGNGNLAITDDRGLYFINHDLADPLKPRQIWTQGETESSSHWFPTIDAPNQKMTQRIAMTVPDTMVTLSNGMLVKSEKKPNGFRTDIWEQKLPHAPYLSMMAVGNWSVVKDNWRNKEVNYYVEKKYQPYAKMTFGNTPEMMEFFSNFLGVDFAWDKYSQVVVRDFVSGAMENTSATVHMESLQQTPDEFRDKSMEDYVSHELFHQWFGDLVTAESWANITVNESFATYGEYLWRNYKYGQTSADYILEDFRDNYNWLGFDADKTLVRFNYHKEGEMFDNVSYQKGALILHMLRNFLGDTIFRKGLKKYLTDFRFQSAEAVNLRLCMEAVSGKDLNWFFDQWYLGKGHPEIVLSFSSKIPREPIHLYIQQTQTYRNCFNFPISIKYGYGGKVFSKQVFVKNRTEDVVLDLTENPDWLIFDADNCLLSETRFSTGNAADAASTIRMLEKSWDNAETEGLKYTILTQAARIGRYAIEPAVQEAITPLLHKAMHSNFEFSVKLALEMLNEELTDSASSVFGFSKDSILAVVNRPGLNSVSRSRALVTLYYMKLPETDMLKFTSDSSTMVSERAIYLLDDTGKWQETAKKAIAAENRQDVIVTWARKLIGAGLQNKIQTLETVLTNPASGAEGFQISLRNAWQESNNVEDLSIATWFYNQLNKDTNSVYYKILKYEARRELKVVKAEMKKLAALGETPEKALVEKQQFLEKAAGPIPLD